MADAILDVDLLAFETGGADQRRAVIDGVRRSLATGFVYTSHDLPEDVLDTAYGMLEEFFALPAETKQKWVAPGTNGQTGYTGLLVETAATSEHPDWKEMLNWGRPVPEGHPLRTRYPHRYHDPVLPEGDVPGITKVLADMHDRVSVLLRRFLRVIALGLGAAEDLFESITADAPDLTRAIHYPSMQLAPGAEHVWAGEHGDINLITALPRATAKGLQVKTDEQGWIDAVPPVWPRRDQHRDHVGPHLQRADPHRHPPRGRRPRRTRRPLLRRPVLPPHAVGRAGATALVHHAGEPAAPPPRRRRLPARPGPLGDQPRRRRPPGLAESERIFPIALVN